MDDQAPKKEFIPWADLMRVVATVLVVIIHVSGQITNVWGKVPVSEWFLANVYGGIARVSVPLFFMISGYLLLPRSESLGAFYKKRIPKVLIPLIIWSFIYLGWYCYNHSGTCTPRLIQDMLLVQGAYYHLWFLRALLGIYLILPVLRLTIQPDTDRKILWYLIVLWLIFQPGFAMANQFLGIRIRLSAPLTTGFVGFFFLGYLLGRWTLSRFMIVASAVAFFLATLVTVVGTYLMTRSSGQFEGFFYDFTSLNVILASASAFILLIWTSETKVLASPKAHDFIRWIASTSLGVYLIHVIIIEVLQGWIPGFHLDSFVGNPLWSVPLLSAVVFVLSFFIVRILQRIPILGRIVPG